MNNIIVIDFETFYSSDFTLKNLNYVEYVNDPRFEVIGVSVKVDDESAEWFSGTREQTRKWLNQFPWSDSLAIAHNTAFDGYILNNYFGIKPAAYADTLSMARPKHGANVGGSLSKLADHYGIGQKGTEVINAMGKYRKDFSPAQLAAYGQYCINDTELTHKLFHILLQELPPIELKVIDCTIRMTVEPRLVYDTQMLKDALEDLRLRKERVLEEVGITKEDLMSNDKFAKVLANLGIEPPRKISPTTGKETYAFAKTDPGMVELLEHEDDTIQLIAAARVETKSTLAEGRMQRLIRASEFGPIPFPLRYAGAHTNRFSGDWKWNLQNLPKHKDPKNGKREALRDALGCPEGHSIIAIDSSQVEARVNAWLSGETELNHLFATGGDPYCSFASVVYNRQITKADVTERFVGKGCVLGLGFQMGGRKLQVSLKKPVNGVSADLPEQECKRLVDTYRYKYRQIVKFWSACGKAIDAMYEGIQYEFGEGANIRVEHEALVLPSGARLYYHNLTRSPGERGFEYTYTDREGKKTKKIYSGLLCENIVQSVARDIICWQMVKAHKMGYPAVGTVHDELIFIVPDETVEDDMATLDGVMKSVPKWAEGCPISCEGAYAKCYGRT